MREYFRALEFVKPYWKTLLVGFFLTVVLFLISLAPIAFVGWLFEIIAEGNRSRLNLLFGVIIIVFFADMGLGFLSHYLFIKMNQTIGYDVRMTFFAHVQKLSLKFFDERRTGGLVYRLFSDTESIPGITTSVLIDMALYLVTLLVVGGWMVVLDPGLACLCFMIAPLHIIVIWLFKKPVRRWSEKIRWKDETLSGDAIEYFSGIRVIKSCGTEGAEYNRFRDSMDERLSWGIRSNMIAMVSNLSVGTVNNVWSFLVLWYGGLQVMEGVLGWGELIMFLLLVGRLYVPISGITYTVIDFQAVMVGIKRVFEILDTQPEVVEGKTPVDLNEVKGEIEFKNVSFSYESGKPVLQNISFKVQPGETIALVGRSGAGKSTLMNLLARFYDPDEGEIVIDGHSLKQISLESLRQNVGMVLQDNFLFSGTISENIGYRMEVDENEILDAAKAAHVDEFVSMLPQGYQTLVGERGIKLSGGQRQRIAIARALLRNPSILILDEATSSVDIEAEGLIQEALRKLMVNRTTLVIAHRLSTIERADRLLVLDNGKLSEEGTHKELLERNGVYSDLYKRLARI